MPSFKDGVGVGERCGTESEDNPGISSLSGDSCRLVMASSGGRALSCRGGVDIHRPGGENDVEFVLTEVGRVTSGRGVGEDKAGLLGRESSSMGDRLLSVCKGRGAVTGDASAASATGVSDVAACIPIDVYVLDGIIADATIGKKI